MYRVLFILLVIADCFVLSGNPVITEKKFFFQHLNLDYPGLNKCKRMVEKNDYDKAFEEYVHFFENRKDRVYYYNPKDFVERVDLLKKKAPDYVANAILKADSLKEFVYEIEGEKYKWKSGIITWRDENKEWINVLNRLYCLRDLYIAYYATGRSEYFDSYCNYMWGWIRANEVPLYRVAMTGGTWEPFRQSYTSPHGPWRALEVGIRVSNMLDAYYATYQNSRISLDMKWEFFKSLMEHELYIMDYLKRGALGNWESTVASGFVSLCAMTPEWKCSDELINYSILTINANLKNAFNKDGFQFETTTGYHKHVVEGYIKTAYLLYKLNDIKFLDMENLNILKKAVDIVLMMKKPNGADPVIGDCVQEYSEYGENVNSDDFFVGAWLLFHDHQYKKLSGTLLPESLLIYGNSDHDSEINSNIGSYSSLGYQKSLFLDDSQLAVMRSSAREDSGMLYMLFDNALDGVGAHQHHDFLNIELFAYDRTLIIDPGRGSNYNHPLFKSYYRTVAGHNVIQVGVDNTCQERRRVKGSVRNLKWVSNDNFDFASGIMKSYNGVDIIRNVFFIKGEYWFIYDEILGNEKKDLLWRFHLPPGRVEYDSVSKVFNTLDTEHSNISIVLFGGTTARIGNGYVFDGKTNIWAPVAEIFDKKDLPASNAFVLYPRNKGVPSYKFKSVFVKTNIETEYILDFGNGRKDSFIISGGYNKNNTINIQYRQLENGNEIRRLFNYYE